MWGHRVPELRFKVESAEGGVGSGLPAIILRLAITNESTLEPAAPSGCAAAVQVGKLNCAKALAG